MSVTKYKPGISQAERNLPALQPDYVSVEERSLVDLLKFARTYAKHVRYYNDANQADGFWEAFLAYSDTELAELAGFAENPEIFAEDSTRIAKYGKPHLAMLVTFMKLLQHPKEQFAELTEKNLAFFYRDVLKLEELAEVPDEVHLVLKLAKDVKEHLVTKGTRFYAGKDNTGADLQYEIQEDQVINNAELSDLKTIHFKKATTDIQYVHENNNRGDLGFEKILCLVLGNLDTLPEYQSSYSTSFKVDAAYLRTELYERIKNKEKDEIDQSDANYIFSSLCFRYLKDFRYCLELLYREMNRGYVGVTYPEDDEWQKAYAILEKVHTERHSRSRREELKAVHKNQGFETMMEYAFGEPEPGNMLYKMPDHVSNFAMLKDNALLQALAALDNDSIRTFIPVKLGMTFNRFKELVTGNYTGNEATAELEKIGTLLSEITLLEALFLLPNEASRNYIEDKLCMPVDDFKVITLKKDTSLTSTAGDEVYTLLEKAWTKKREYSYPAIGDDIIEGFYANTIYNAETHDRVERFRNFSHASSSESSEHINMGFSISSPLLKLHEGERSVDIYISCQEGTINYEAIAKVLEEQTRLFSTYLTTKDGWQEVTDLDFSTGSRIIKPAAKNYAKKEAYLVCDTIKYDAFDTDCSNKYILHKNAKVYKIVRHDLQTNKIYLKAVSLAYTAGETRLINRLVPKNFVSELKETLLLDETTTVVTSSMEIFNENHKGNYLVDSQGNIYYIHEFLSANEVTVRYSGSIAASDDATLLVNKVWERIDPDYALAAGNTDITGLDISEISIKNSDITFYITGSQISITCPETTTAAQVVNAWQTWIDNPDNQQGSFSITQNGNGQAEVVPINREMEATGEILKQYESPETHGLYITYSGRPADKAYFIIKEPVDDNEYATFLISGLTLTITLGTVSKTANQIAADWQLWLEEPGNQAKGFSIKSKDSHYWKAEAESETYLEQVDRQIRKIDICNLYGNGIRVLHNGFEADAPKIIIKENSIDMFEFDVKGDDSLTIQYPSLSTTSGNDLFEAWSEWKSSVLNDAKNFSIELLGDGLWQVSGETIEELQSIEDQRIECTIAEAGLIIMFQPSEQYSNAKVTFVKGADFNFEFGETGSDKILTITYPELSIDTTDETLANSQRKQHVQKLLNRWNREYKKHGFIITQNKTYDEATGTFEDALWQESFPATDPYTIDFSVNFNYVKTIHVDGFKVKYKPQPEFENFKAIVHVIENEKDTFKFQVENDYYNSERHLYIHYPVDKKNRTVEQLLAAWYWHHKDNDSSGFSIVISGSGKWEIEGVTREALTSTITALTLLMDPVNRQFYQYSTKDVEGFSIFYTGPSGTSPRITIAENETDEFTIDVRSSYDDFHNVYIEEFLTITYPGREDKRTMVNLLKAWHQWKKGKDNHFLGFTISDTSPIVTYRAKDILLTTGDKVRSYIAGSSQGFSVTHIGDQDTVTITIKEREDFSDDDVSGNMLWDNGELFTIMEKIDAHTVTVEHYGSITADNTITLYDKDAISFDTLHFTLHIDSEFPPIVTSSEHEMTTWPAVKILLNNSMQTADDSGAALLYENLHAICMRKIDLRVNAKGISDIKMRGNISMINTENNFNPFGTAPNKDARFYFANQEICEKKLDSLDIRLQWAPGKYTTDDGFPDLSKHYYTYAHCGLDNVGTITNNDFTIDLTFLDKRTFIDISKEPQPLFSDTLLFTGFTQQSYQGELFTDTNDIPKDPLDWSRYFKLELSGKGSMQDIYSDVLKKSTQASQNFTTAESSYQAIKQEIEARDAQVRADKQAEAEARAKGDAYTPTVIPEARSLPELPENDRDLSQLTVNEPFTPTVASMLIDYTASAQIILDDETEDSSTTLPVKIFRYHPFGHIELGKSNDEDDYLLPQYEQQGYLLIGIKNLQPLQNISLLVQVVSGSGDVNLDIPEVTWSYLSGNTWKPFKEADILKDMTYGLQDSGILRFRIPEDATTDNTLLPENRCWIKAEVVNNINAFPDILDVQAQALSVQYVNNNNDPEHLATPLAADTIKELVSRDASIQEIAQPFSSFNGQMRESNKNFYIRSSERLKHKQRALTLKDYENLILSKFAEIYKVKCIPQGELKELDSSSEGEVVVVVILKNKNSKPFFPLKPKTPANILNEISTYIRDYMPALVNVRVVNPRFEEIRYRLAVKFQQGCDQGYYINKLNEDIQKFLSPWAYDQEAEISFGSSVYSSSVINFIENTDYVDYVANFSLLQQIISHETYTEVVPLFLTEENAATVKYPDSILVSSESHIIDVIHSDSYDAGSYNGIGYMQIGTDFWISRPGPVFVTGIGDMEIESWPVSRYGFAGIKVDLQGEDATTKFETTFAREDSQLLWNWLREASYLDEKGNVITTDDIYDDTYHLISASGTFEHYLQTSLANFIFSETLDGTTIKAIRNIQEIEDTLLETLKNAQNFTGISQYPFIVS